MGHESQFGEPILADHAVAREQHGIALSCRKPKVAGADISEPVRAFHKDDSAIMLCQGFESRADPEVDGVVFDHDQASEGGSAVLEHAMQAR